MIALTLENRIEMVGKTAGKQTVAIPGIDDEFALLLFQKGSMPVKVCCRETRTKEVHQELTEYVKLRKR